MFGRAGDRRGLERSPCLSVGTATANGAAFIAGGAQNGCGDTRLVLPPSPADGLRL